MLIQLMTPEEYDPLYNGRMNLIDLESADMMDARNMKLKITRSLQIAYAEALNDLIEELRSYCVSRQAGFISVHTDQPIERMLFAELMKAGVME